MFEDPKFWNHWPKTQRISFFTLILLSILSFFLLLVGFYSGGSFVVDWDQEITTRPIRVVYDEFRSGLYNFLIYADNYVLNKSFKSGDFSVNEPIAYLYFTGFVLGLLFLFSLSTTLSRFYYYVSAGFLLLILLTFKFENLLILGLYGKEVLFIVFLLLGLTGYYFQAFRSDISLSKRYLTFCFISLIIGLLIYFFAEVDKPFYYLAAYSVISTMVLSVAFILMIGFEIAKGILLITLKSSAGQGRSSFTHFSIIIIVYLAVLILMFLNNEGYIGWRLVFINPVWILLIATILGLWGFRDKESTFSSIISFRPYGLYAYLTGAIICFLSVGFFMASANDPYEDIIEDAIVFSQLSFTLIFYVYILANFFPAMMEGMNVYKVLYKPSFMPFFSARLAAMIGVFSLGVFIKSLPYYQSYAGYYISIAKLHMVLEENIIAKEYFELANIYGRQTHLGNFALAKMAENQDNISDKSTYLVKSINQNPSEFAIADLALLFSKRERYFDALFTLKKGLNRFPDSGPLQNNIGLLLANSKALDSAAIFFESAASKNVSNVAAETNLISIFALNDFRISKDSLQLFLDEYSSVPVFNNLIVSAQRQNIKDLRLDTPPVYDQKTNIDQLVYNFNYTLYNYEEVDSSSWKKFRDFYSQTNFTGFEQNIEYAFAMAFAKKNYSIPAFRIFNVLNQSDIYGYSKYDLLLAQLYMKYGAPFEALDHFEHTSGYYENQILTQKAFALMEAGRLNQAHEIWEKMQVMDGLSENPLPNEMVNLLSMESYRNTLDQDDPVKFNFLKYRGFTLNFEEYEGLILSMQNDYYKALAYLELSQRYYSETEFDEALRILNKVNLQEQSDDMLIKEFLKLKAQVLVELENIKGIQESINTLKGYKDLQPYYLLLQAALKNWEGNIKEAEGLYLELSNTDAFCETCILKSSEYFTDQKFEPMKAYEILLSAIKINKYSYKLNKAYIESCLALGLDSYAEDTLERLEDILSPERYTQLELIISEASKEEDFTW